MIFLIEIIMIKLYISHCDFSPEKVSLYLVLRKGLDILS